MRKWGQKILNKREFLNMAQLKRGVPVLYTLWCDRGIIDVVVYKGIENRKVICKKYLKKRLSHLKDQAEKSFAFLCSAFVTFKR